MRETFSRTTCSWKSISTDRSLTLADKHWITTFEKQYSYNLKYSFKVRNTLDISIFILSFTLRFLHFRHVWVLYVFSNLLPVLFYQYQHPPLFSHLLFKCSLLYLTAENPVSSGQQKKNLILSRIVVVYHYSTISFVKWNKSLRLISACFDCFKICLNSTQP